MARPTIAMFEEAIKKLTPELQEQASKVVDGISNGNTKRKLWSDFFKNNNIELPVTVAKISNNADEAAKIASLQRYKTDKFERAHIRGYSDIEGHTATKASSYSSNHLELNENAKYMSPSEYKNYDRQYREMVNSANQYVDLHKKTVVKEEQDFYAKKAGDALYESVKIQDDFNSASKRAGNDARKQTDEKIRIVAEEKAQRINAAQERLQQQRLNRQNAEFTRNDRAAARAENKKAYDLEQKKQKIRDRIEARRRGEEVQYEGDLDGMNPIKGIDENTPMSKLNTPDSPDPKKDRATEIEFRNDTKSLKEARNRKSTYYNHETGKEEIYKSNHRKDAEILNAKDEANKSFFDRVKDKASSMSENVADTLNGNTATQRRRRYNETVDPNKGQAYVTSNSEMRRLERKHSGRDINADYVQMAADNASSGIDGSGIIDWMKENPLKTAGIVAATGIGVGGLMSRSRDGD